jgi:hypothetical protein
MVSSRQVRCLVLRDGLRVTTLEVKHFEEVANRRHVLRNIGVAGIDYRIWQIVAAPAGQWPKAPVSLDEFHQHISGPLDVHK